MSKVENPIRAIAVNVHVQYIFTYMSWFGNSLRDKKSTYMSWFWGGEAAPKIHLYVLVWGNFVRCGGWGGEAALKCL